MLLVKKIHFLKTSIVQGSVATWCRCGESFNDRFIV